MYFPKFYYCNRYRCSRRLSIITMPVYSFRQFQRFRENFVIPQENMLRWFPGHMATSFKKMQAKLKSVDCIIEVHDARIPFSGRNPNFKHRILGLKPHILVLNKVDLLDSKFKEMIVSQLKKEEGITDVVFTCCKKQDSDGVKDLLPLIKDKIKNSDRFNRSMNREYGVMIIGVPNVGKSSLINSVRTKFLKKGGAAHVGANAGVTRAVQNRIKVSNSPPVYVYDTPGILTPNIPDVEVGMRLAVCATNQDHLVGFITIADYLIYWCNKNNYLNYMDYFQITEQSDDTYLLLAKLAVRLNLYERLKMFDGSTGYMNKPSIQTAAKRFVSAFRTGTLGNVLLDVDRVR